MVRDLPPNPGFRAEMARSNIPGAPGRSAPSCDIRRTSSVFDLVTLLPGAEASVKIVLRGGGTLEGRIVDDRHFPLAGVRVDIASTQGILERTTRTADDGTFGFAAVPGGDRLFGEPTRCHRRRGPTVDPDHQRDRAKADELVLPAPRETMTVHVSDARGAAIAGAQVLAVSLASDSPLRHTSFTDREGNALFKDAVGLAMRVQVSHRGRAPAVSRNQRGPR